MGGGRREGRVRVGVGALLLETVDLDLLLDLLELESEHLVLFLEDKVLDLLLLELADLHSGRV